ncbi:MAG: hypothetical protein KAT32_02930 [Candidatus Moranbacteria bacterium]|nr:hypothetical protein [Candidatus Moranbacteria bacterium]
MEATQFVVSSTFKRGGFLGFFCDVYYCEARIIKSEPIYKKFFGEKVGGGAVQRKVNLEIISVIWSASRQNSQELSFYVPVEDCNAERMFESVQLVIEQLNQKKENLLRSMPDANCNDLSNLIIFLSGIKLQDIFVTPVT